MFANLETLKTLAHSLTSNVPVHPLSKAVLMETQAAEDLSSQSDVQVMVNTYQALGDIKALAVFRADGENYAFAKGRFFVSCVALYAYLGDEPARKHVREVWADSKAAPREYALKIFRMCKAAVEAHGLPKVEAVTGYAQLADLVPAREAIEHAKADANKALNDVAARGLTAEQQAAVDEAKNDVQSRAADIAATMDMFDSLVQRMQGLTDGKSVKKADVAALAGEMVALRASVATLFNVQ